MVQEDQKSSSGYVPILRHSSELRALATATESADVKLGSHLDPFECAGNYQASHLLVCIRISRWQRGSGTLAGQYTMSFCAQGETRRQIKIGVQSRPHGDFPLAVSHRSRRGRFRIPSKTESACTPSILEHHLPGNRPRLASDAPRRMQKMALRQGLSTPVR